MKTKAEFLSSPKRANLSPKEKEKRWQQYRASQIGTSSAKRGTKIRVIETQSGPAAQLNLSKCAADYFKGMIHPFSCKDPLCIPDLHAVPSKKIRCKLRGTFSTGTGGVGQVIVFPWCTSNNSTTAMTTGATYAGPATVQNSGVGVSQDFMTKLPYATASFARTTTGGIHARLVACAVRIRYIGPELARSGQIVGFREPDNLDVVGYSYSRLRSLETSKTFRNKRQWIYAIYRPVEPDEYRFAASECGPGDALNINANLGFVIEGTTDSTGAPGPAPFEYEVIKFIEYIGNIDNITRSHVDLTGLSHVRNAIPYKSVTDNIIHHASSALQEIKNSAESVAPVVGTAALAHHLMSGSEEASLLSKVGNFISHPIDTISNFVVDEAPQVARLAGPVIEDFEAVAPYVAAGF